jgi:dipeptidyl aminopeptidase/acylaminoacyl peptidase
VTNMSRLERIVAELPEAERVDIAEWGDHPSFRVRGKNFVFSDAKAQHLSVKLSREEAAAVVATDSAATPPATVLVDTAGSTSQFHRLSVASAGKRSGCGCVARTRWSRPSSWPISRSSRRGRNKSG